MIIVRFWFRTQLGRGDEAAAALLPVLEASRALPGVISIDFGRDITDPDSFVATELYEDRAALDRQEALPETIAALATLKGGIIAESDALIHVVERTERFLSHRGDAPDRTPGIDSGPTTAPPCHPRSVLA